MKAGVLALLLLLALPAQAQMYKCKDARGVTRYSDKPMPDCPGQAVDIRAQPPVSGKIDTYGSDVGGAERDFQKRQQERDREAQAQAQAAEDQKRRCEQMRATYQRFISLNRVWKPGPNGERIYMDSATRDAKTAEMEAQIARECR